MHRARAEGVLREHTDKNSRPLSVWSVLYFRLCVLAAGRFAAGELDASPRSPLSLPAEKCIISVRLRVSAPPW